MADGQHRDAHRRAEPRHLSAPDGQLIPLRRRPERPAAQPALPDATQAADESTHGALEAIFPPIADYAFLSDCENTCLVAPTGAIEWLCLPRPHDPSVFGTILDRAAGSFRLAPADTAVPANRRYLPGTTVLVTTWQTRTGWLVVHDFLAMGPWYRTAGRSPQGRRTPGDFDAKHVFIRMATCVHGGIDLALDCEPSFDYGRVDGRWEYAGAGYDAVRTTNPETVPLTLSGDLRLGIEGRAVRARHRLSEGDSCYLALSWGDVTPPVDLAEAKTWQGQTERFWRGWLDRGRFPDHPWREQLQRSALTLKGLTYASTGALLAAPTTSLPEHPGGTRNWDHRYTWVRDAAFTLWALHALGFDAEADDFLAFLGDVLEPGSGTGERPAARLLRALYAVDGTRPPPEAELEHLSGYGGSRPVRVGNAAEEQEQLDILGAVVDCVYQHTRSRDSLNERSWRIVVHAVETVLATWREPDHSIWETRGEARHFTYSKVMCWVAADRGARLAALRGEGERADRWWQAALEIHADVCEHGIDAEGRFVQYYGSEALDASLLVLPLVRFLPPTDERLQATIQGIAQGLTQNGFVQRYRTETTDDGIDGPEGCFTVCSFWLVSALIEIGDTAGAHKLCERLLASASGLGLYGEELDPTTGRHLGNFPQALTHLALVNAVLHVIEADQRASEVPLGPSASTWWAAAGGGEGMRSSAV